MCLPTLRRVLVALCLGAGVAAMAGETPKAPPRLEILWYCGEQREALTKLVGGYTAAEVSVRCVPRAEWPEALRDDLAAARGADLAMVSPTALGAAAAGQQLVELTEWLPANVEVADYAPNALRAYGEYPSGSGRLYAVPAQADAQLLVYRRDLYESAELRGSYKAARGRELALPVLWSELLSQAKFFHQVAWTQAGYAAAWQGAGGHDEIATQWNALLWSFGGALWDPASRRIEGVLNRAVSIRALQFATVLFANTPPGSGDYGAGEVIDALCGGKAALGSSWFGAAAAFTDPRRCKLADRLGFAVPPGENQRALSRAGEGLAVAARSPQRAAALALVKWFAAADTQAAWARLGGLPPRRSVLDSPAFAAAAPYNRYFAEAFGLTRDTWVLPQAPALLRLQQQYLSLAVRGQMPPKDALDTLASRQQELLGR